MWRGLKMGDVQECEREGKCNRKQRQMPLDPF
jgi:hypothetical protein